MLPADGAAPSAAPVAPFIPVAPAIPAPQASPPDDAALLACMATRDVAALGTLYDRHGRRAFALAHRMVQNPEVAEEIVQDAFLAAWRRADRFAPARGD